MSRDELETEEYEAWEAHQEEGAAVLESQWYDRQLANAEGLRDAALAYVNEELKALAELCGPLPEPVDGVRHANYELVSIIEAALRKETP